MKIKSNVNISLHTYFQFCRHDYLKTSKYFLSLLKGYIITPKYMNIISNISFIYYKHAFNLPS